MLLTESIAFDYIVDLPGVLEHVRIANYFLIRASTGSWRLTGVSLTRRRNLVDFDPLTDLQYAQCTTCAHNAE
jgi:hypothetical protein